MAALGFPAQLILGSFYKGWWDHGALLLPDGRAAPGRAPPVLGVWRARTASAGRGSAHGSKDIPAPAHRAWAGGIGCRQLPAAFHLRPGARFPSPAALQARGQESRGRADVPDLAALPARPLAGGVAGRCPRRAVGAKAASHPMHPTHPAPSSLARCRLSWDGARQSLGLEATALCTFPARFPISPRSCRQREQRELGCRQELHVSAGGEGVLLGHVWSALCVCVWHVCACVSTCVCSGASASVGRYINIYIYIHIDVHL